MPAKGAMAPIALYNWNGFYIGGNLGYGWNNISTDSTNLSGGDLITSSSDRNGVFGGGQLGYNWQFDPNWLVGVEADIDAASITGSHDACSAPTQCSHSDGKNDWFGTLRARFGFVQDNWLFFATGGVVWLHGTTTRTITLSPSHAFDGLAATASGTDAGWTVGGGIDWGFAPNWSVNLEYRYMDVNADRDFIYPTASSASRHNESTEKINTVRISLDYHFH